MLPPKSFTAFTGDHLLVSGDLNTVLTATKQHLDRVDDNQLLIFEDDTGRQIDFNFQGSLAEVLERVAPQPQKAGPGRPKLGVVSREISLLPRHWEWLEQQPNGISATLRRLIEEAIKRDPDAQRARRGRDAANSFMMVMAGNRPNYEEACRALYANDQERLEELVRDWPQDIRSHLWRILRESGVIKAS